MCKALIVEDDTAFRHMLREILRARFPTMTIEEERDESKLFSKLNAFHPNIVFIDISLPKKNGLALTKEIKINYSDIIVVCWRVMTFQNIGKRLLSVRQIISSQEIPNSGFPCFGRIHSTLAKK